LATGVELELSEELLELLDGNNVEEEGEEENRCKGMNGFAAEFRLLLTAGIELELLEELLELVKLLELLEDDEVGSNGGYGGKLLLGGNGVGYSEVGGTYEDAVNDNGNTGGNTDVGG
jgi:hypothetical protein